MKGLGLACAAAMLAVAAGAPPAAQAVTFVDGFQGPFAPANWTQDLNGGTINTSNAPDRVILTGADDDVPASTDFTITSSASGTVSFDWRFRSFDVDPDGGPDGPAFDPFGYTVNGTFFQLSDDAGPLIQTGTVSFEVNAGDEFGFSQQTVDGQFGFARTRITNFRAPVPGPLSALAVLPLAGMAAYRRRFHGWIRMD